MISFVLYLFIEYMEISVELLGIFRFKFSRFEFDCYHTFEFAMIEEHINEVFFF